MNIVNKLTIRHLKQNKRRTLVTMIGVIISVAMLTAVATIGVSFMDLMQKEMIAAEGEWHVIYKDVNSEQIAAIKNDAETKALVLSRDRGYAYLEGSQNVFKPYLIIKQYNSAGFTQFPIELIEGRFPQADNEVVISEAIATNGKVHYKIGDTLELEVGDRILKNTEFGNETLSQNYSFQIVNDEINETLINNVPESYTVVGYIKRPTWEPTWAPGYTIISYIDERTISATDTVHATVVLNKVKASLFDHAEKLAERSNIGKISFNSDLLRLYGVMKGGNIRTSLYSLSAIIMSVIIVGSVSLIYNAFAISVSERSRHLGMLSSVGATKKQKRNSVFFEGAVIGLISIPIGIICGLIGIGITFYFINTQIHGALGVNEKLNVVVTPLSLITASVVSILTIFISTYIPAIRASRISAIDAIRQVTDVKLTRKTVKTSRIIRKLLGLEAEIGLKNLKRHKRRYQATVFSLVISIILFMSVSYFTEGLNKSIRLTQEGINYDIQVSISVKDSKIDASLVEYIVTLDDVTESNVIQVMRAGTWIDEALMADELRDEIYGGNMKDGKFPYAITIHGLSVQRLRDYAEAIGVDYEQLANKDHPKAIAINEVRYYDPVAERYIETQAIHAEVGQQFELVDMISGDEADIPIGNIDIVAFSDIMPMGVKNPRLGELSFIVSEQVMTHLKDQEIVGAGLYVFLKSDDPLKTQSEIENGAALQNVSIFNEFQQRQQEQQMLMLLSVFTYGFIALITAISIANIFNTISTSISLRKREFAMLKSVGMTPKGFNKMVNYESIFYGVKALLYGLPLSLAIILLMHNSLSRGFNYKFAVPWATIIFVIVAVFAIVGMAMLYSSSKVKKENIIDALKQESI